MEKKKTGIMDKLENVDARVISWLIVILIAIPNIIPLSLPIPISPETRKFYSIVESVPAGSAVIFGTDSSIEALGEQMIALEPIFRHLVKRPIKIVICTFREPGSALIPDMLFSRVDMRGKVYGVDYVNLGFAAGKAAAVSAFANDIQEVFKKDFYGTSIEKIPMMSSIRSIKDISLIVDVSDHDVSGLYLRQVVIPYGTKFIAAEAAMIYIQSLPYLNPGQYESLIPSQRGGAEYEKLIGVPGGGAKIMDSQSVGHMIIIVLMVIGNSIYLLKRYGRRQ